MAAPRHATNPAMLLLGPRNLPTGQVREVFTEKACAFASKPMRGVLMPCTIRTGTR
jgi:hypothetical protein